MKKILASLCTITLFLPIFSGITFSMSNSENSLEEKLDSKFPKTVFEHTEQQVENLKNSEISEDFDSWEWRNIKSVLETEQQGGINFFYGNNEISENLNILTGKSSMNDSMQLGDFSSGIENKQKFLEDVTQAIENYKQNSDKREYPESLEDFKKYEDEWWAEIRMGNNWSIPQKNISEISDLLEYKKNKKVIKSEVYKAIEHYKDSYWSISTSHPSGSINASANIVWLNRWDKKEKKWIQVKNLGGFNSQYFSTIYKHNNKPHNGYDKISDNPHKKNISPEIIETDRYLFLANSFENFAQQINTQKEECYASNYSGGNTERDDNFWTCLSPKKNIFNILLKDKYEESFSLTLKPEKFNIEISDIQKIETKSHDFEELLEELDDTATGSVSNISGIYSLIPADTFSVYFSNPEKYREFSETLSNPLSEISQILPLPTVNKMEEMIGKRLNIGDPKKFLSAVTEFAFVGDDIRIFPSSDFALIFKCKSNLACKIFGAEKIKIENGETFFVLASDQKFLEKIKILKEEICPDMPGKPCIIIDNNGLINEKDFQYSWAVTENRRDGFIFFSDAFIRKMVSPEYRINLRRQKSVVETMNALQYLVWVYKKNDINHNFPEKISDLIAKKYISENSIFQLEKYSIQNTESESGIISHETWGTPFEITPVTRVEISEISEGEKKWYEDDVDIYESDYQEFFDPIGVSITVGDKISFHTVILPLSDSEEYQILKTIGGNISKENFDLAGKYPTAMEGIMSFDVDEILYETGKLHTESKGKAEDSMRISDIMAISNALAFYYSDTGEYPLRGNIKKELSLYFDDFPVDPSGEEYEYQPFVKNDVTESCYRISARLTSESVSRMKNDNGVNENLFEKGVCEEDWEKVFAYKKITSPRISKTIQEPTKQEIIAKAEKTILDELKLKWGSPDERIFDFLGDEIMLGFGEKMMFDFDVYDTSGLDIFLTLKLNNKEKAEQFFLAFVKLIAKEMRGGRGFFQMNKPIKNTWSTGKKEKDKKEYYSLPLGFVNIFVFFDEDRVSFAVSQNTIHNMIEGSSAKNSKNSSQNFSRLHTFLKGEKNILLTADTQKITNWFDIIPKEMKQEFNEEIIKELIRGNNNSYEAEYFLLSEVLGEKFMTAHFSYYPETLGYIAKFTPKGKIYLENIQTGKIFSGENKQEIVKLMYQEIDILNIIQKFLREYGEVGLSFAFTKHGAEIKIAFDNTKNSQLDERFESERANSAEGQNIPDFVKTTSAKVDLLKNIFSSENPNIKKIIGIGGTAFLILIGGLIFLVRRRK